MFKFSNEAIIALVTLVTGCPPSILLIWHLIRRRRCVDSDQNERSRSYRILSWRGQNVNILTVDQLDLVRLPTHIFIEHVNLLVSQPGLAYLPDRSQALNAVYAQVGESGSRGISDTSR